jgi:hypothetical protein
MASYPDNPPFLIKVHSIEIEWKTAKSPQQEKKFTDKRVNHGRNENSKKHKFLLDF